MALLVPFGGHRPRVAPDAFLAPNAVLVGNVRVGAGASVWFGAVLRGDHPEHGIEVGPRTSIQDNCVLHVGPWQPTQVGADVTVGHGAKLESCTIEDRSVIGMNAVILQNACIGEGSLVAANSVVLEGMKVPPGSLVAGVPGRIRKTLSGSAAQWIERSSAHYVELAASYRAQMAQIQMEDAALRCRVCGADLGGGHGTLLCPECGHRYDWADLQGSG